MITLARYIIIEHFNLAVDGALLFAVGLFIAVPTVKYRLGFAEWLPLKFMKLVQRLMGPSASFWRIVFVIWVFNSMAMFIYMASGFHQLIPQIFAIWTGLNIGVIIAHSQREAREGRGTFLFDQPPGSWKPSPAIAGMCGLLVLFLELACFFYVIALGMRMGAEVSWGGVGYLDSLQPRATAYAAVIMPLLFISAVAETIAIRGGMPEEIEV